MNKIVIAEILTLVSPFRDLIYVEVCCVCVPLLCLVLFVSGGWYSSYSDTQSLFTRHPSCRSSESSYGMVHLVAGGVVSRPKCVVSLMRFAKSVLGLSLWPPCCSCLCLLSTEFHGAPPSP
jgi:hypothetical protein